MNQKNKELIDLELGNLYAKGELTKPNVVKRAENPKSPLHKVIFYCNDVKAAYEHRLHKAGELIREFETKIIVQKMEVRVPKWVHTTTSPGYVHVVSLKTNKTVAREFMRNELTMMRALADRCYRFALVLGLDGDLGKILDQIDLVLQRMQDKTEQPKTGSKPRR